MKITPQAVALLLAGTLICSACAFLPRDHTGPTISDISTSGNVIVISDCPSTSATITARVTDESAITSVELWYRVETDKTFAFTKMELQNNLYAATLEGTNLQGHGYGVIEFYVTAEDERGNSSKSSIDKSIQFLPCVNN